MRAPPLAPGGEGPGPLRRQSTVGRRRIQRVEVSASGPHVRTLRDVVATEEPLEIVLRDEGGARPVGVTMRTPGADFDLVAGFLFAEGVIDGPEAIRSMRYCPGAASGAASGEANVQLYNRVEVRLTGRTGRPLPRRDGYTPSSCGVCGVTSIEAVMSLGCPPVRCDWAVAAEVLLTLPDRLRAEQPIFDRTGGLHAAALFDLRGQPVCIREDVGRHNALDKLVGAALREGRLPLERSLLLLSSRLSFELVQKAARAGIAVVAGVSAPSTLAVALAERAGITLVGFLRGSAFNIYAGAGRIDLDTAPAAGSESR